MVLIVYSVIGAICYVAPLNLDIELNWLNLIETIYACRVEVVVLCRLESGNESRKILC